MENYYETLEISENASQEVIERVYKLLAKKYHPDLNPDNPKAAEEKFKKISAAYEVLSNESKRKSYDEKLRAYNASKMAARQQNSANYSQQTPANTYSASNSAGFSQEQYVKYQQELLRKQREKLQKQYDEAYVSALNKLGIRVVYKKTWRERLNSFVALMLTLLVLTIIITIMWLIPPTHDKIVEVYDNSGPFKYIVEIISERGKSISSTAENSETK